MSRGTRSPQVTISALAGRLPARHGAGVDLNLVGELLSAQHGVLSRRQALAHGLTDGDLARALRHKELVRVHTGVYVNHTGPLTWMQRAWAALVFYWPAALCDDSALVAFGLRSALRRLNSSVSLAHAAPGTTHQPVIHVAVDERRRVRNLGGVRVHRVTNLRAVVHPTRRPFVVRLDPALVQMASRASSDADAIALLADACQEGRTTAARLVAVLQDHANIARRGFLLDVLEDVATGANSVLEHTYLTRVERPHGLPTAKRQRRVTIGRTSAYRDVEYLGLGGVVELDGRLGHEQTTDRWRDLDRDIDSLLVGDQTLRAGWGQVLEPCRLAWAVARFLRALGWTGMPRPCGPDCIVPPEPFSKPGSGESSSAREEETPEPGITGTG